MPTTPQLPAERELPPFDGATGWLNSDPLAASELRGKSVIVNFCTYTCINWIRQLPYIRTWAQNYYSDGLVVIGVHTPEFAFEHDIENVRRAISEMRIAYPIAVDSNYAIWRAFANQYWPALYLADSRGRVRHHHFGEGDYERLELIVQQLLGEAGSGGISNGRTSVDARGIEAGADWSVLRSPETYLGYERAERLQSTSEPMLDRPHTYEAPASLGVNEWSLSGDWTLRRESAELNGDHGRIAFRFHARDLHLVMTPPAGGASAQFRVVVDGEAPERAHGLDIDEQGRGTVTEPRLYQLIRQPGPVADHTFEITLHDPGVQAYVFTFG